MTRRTLPISWEEVCSRRLERHGLSSPFETAGPADVAQAICGAHAQVMSAAELSIGLRLANATRDDVRAALWEERTLVKTFGPRGTVHLLPTRDLPMWTAALSQVPQVGGHAKDVRMTPEQTDQVVKAIAAVVEDAELTIDELSDEVVARTGPWAGDLVMPAFQGMWPRWRQALGTAGRRGAVCFGPDRGRKVTYTHPRRWLPGFRPADPKEALPELVRHYLRAFGPATPEHFANWIGGPPRWAAELFESLELRRADLDGNELWLLPEDTAPKAQPPSGVRLLPYFDAYTVGCQPRDLLFPGRASERARAPSGQAGNYPVLLIDGVVAGVWHQRRSGRRLEITVEPFRRLAGARRRELEEQVERIGEFFEARPELAIGTVTVGGHA